MSSTSPIYGWTYPSIGEDPYFTDFVALVTAIDAEMSERTKAASMGGFALNGDHVAGGNLLLASTSNATKGKIYLGASDYYDENTTILHVGGLVVGGGSLVDVVGVVKMYVGATAPSGWHLLQGGTIGDSSSNATVRANADQATLFALLWNAWSNALLPIQDSSGNPTTRQANAAADFASHYRLPLPDISSRLPVGVGTGSGLTARTLGELVGGETHTQTEVELAAHSHGGVTGTESATHTHSMGNALVYNAGSNDFGYLGSKWGNGSTGTESATHTHTISSDGSATPMNIMNPVLGLNFIVKY